MKKKRAILLTVSMFVLLVLIFPSQGLSAAESDTSSGSLLDNFHNPWPGVTMGADFRFRIISADNITTLNDDRPNHNYLFNRYRSRLWMSLSPDDFKDVEFNMRLMWEFRTWCDPENKPQHTNFDEILFDRFNLTLRNLWDGNLTMVVGRQDIIFGTGWLVLDGTPLDGSRTIFFDALRLTYDWKEKDTRIDTVVISNRASAADRLKPINDRTAALTEQDEDGFILYLTNNSMEKTQLEGYYMFKSDNPVDHMYDNFPMAWSRKAKIHTLGGAIQHQFTDNWALRTEGAVQCGNKEDAMGNGHKLIAWGTRNDLSYSFLDELKNKIHFAYEFLSGDDPDTGRNEQFDPLWGEWPQWSELYIYTYSRETMIAETTNLHRFNVGHSFKPTEKLEVKTDYHLLWADENTLKSTNSGDGFGFSKNGKFRGQLLTCWLNYVLTQQLKGHVLLEYFAPGNYYQHNTRSGSYFFRFNLEYTF